MEKPNYFSDDASPIVQIGILIGMVGIGLFVSNLLAIGVILPFYNWDIALVTSILTNISVSGHENRVPILLVQNIISVFTFFVPPVFFMIFSKNNPLKLFSLSEKNTAKLILISALIALVAMPVNSLFIEWNKNMSLPKFLSVFELWAEAKELELEKLTNYLIDFQGVGQFVIGFVTFAIFPALGEELLFRGLLQKIIIRMVANKHIGIWLTAFVFGAIHMQFYGLLPRMLLGVLFGYLYLWSGNLIYPVVAHFMNNGFTVVMVYLFKNGFTDINPESTDSVSWGFILVALFFLTFLIFNFFNLNRKLSISQ